MKKMELFYELYTVQHSIDFKIFSSRSIQELIRGTCCVLGTVISTEGSVTFTQTYYEIDSAFNCS